MAEERWGDFIEWARRARAKPAFDLEERYPGWEFAAHVGYSTPEHRAAIEKLGVSPLHRMSFQSMAYQQLAL